MSSFTLTLSAIASAFIIPQAAYVLTPNRKFLSAIIAHLVSFALCIVFLFSAKGVAKNSNTPSDGSVGSVVGQIAWLITSLLVGAFVSFGVTAWALKDKGDSWSAALFKAFLLTIASLAVFLAALGIVVKTNWQIQY